MKLNINKAYDLNSISVFPPHSRRSNLVSSLPDSSGSGKNTQTYHMRSQSQQQFSQGISLSQLSQGSIDDVLLNEQKFSSQERDSTIKRFSFMAPVANSRDGSQMQQSKSSNYAIKKWNPTCTSDPRCHVSEKLESKFGLVEGSLIKFERILNSVQDDLLQLTKAMKEVTMEVAGIWQKVIVQDGHMQLMLKGEEDIKSSMTEILKSVHEQPRKESAPADQHRVCKIADSISSLPRIIEVRLERLRNEILGAFTKEIEVEEKPHCCQYSKQPSDDNENGATGRPINNMWIPDLLDARTPTAPHTEKRQIIAKDIMNPKHEEIITELTDDSKAMPESDEDLNGGLSCLLKKRKAGSRNHLSEEARKDSMQILRRARKRKRKHDNVIVLD